MHGELDKARAAAERQRFDEDHLQREMQQKLEEEREKVRRAHAKLEERADEIAQLKMALHNAETEVARVANVVECVAELHPTITAHVLKMQPNFGFRDRGLADLAKIRDSNRSGVMDGEEGEEDDEARIFILMWRRV